MDFYKPEYYKKLEFGFKSEKRMDHERILELLKLKDNDKVLEIGCGFGVLLKKIPSKSKVGIETNNLAVKECRKRGLDVVKGNAEKKFLFKDSSFDIIIMNEVIEHLREPEFTLRECFRILRPRGRIIITTPVRSFFAHDLSPTHFSEMNIGELRRLLGKSGFTIIRHEVNGFSFLYPLLETLFFKPFRLLRYASGVKQKGAVKLIDSCHRLADETILAPLSCYRKYFLWLGLDQLILAQKSDCS